MVSIAKFICTIALIGTAVAFGDSKVRERRSLLNTFPFNDGAQNADHSAEHHEEHDHTQAHELLPAASSESRLGRQGDGDDVPLDIGSIAAAGERCIDKVVMVEETEYDDHIECHHSYSERCHTTYTTDFEPQQEEDCEENFKKECFIEYKKVAVDETVKFCHTPLVCEGEGPEECKTVYESECETKYHEHDVEDDVVNCETIQEEKCEDVTQGYTTEQKCTKWPKQVCTNEKKNVKKYSPQTECKKVPRQLCGPSGCVPQPGPEECLTRKKPSSKKSQRSFVTWNPKSPANKSPSWSQLLTLLKNVLTYPRKSAPVPERTQELSRSQLSRNGVTFLLLLLVWPNKIICYFKEWND
ncbi:uncharacterized protein [Lepeophtheirus salmonis]|uniref:uncharacterized protein n=1 Tax=Lepeophtheirus salmonis TaxID=72036 RepID=UPI001AE1CA89|nr:uncharacterized protein LOC121125398 [Lepeophtheirus salmonis]